MNMFLGIIPSVILSLLFASSILAVPTGSCPHAVAPPAPSLPNRRNPSFPTHDCSQNSIPPMRLESPHPSPSPKAQEDKSRSKTSQRNAIIAVSTIGGTFVLCFLLALVRCISRYKRPPKRDRIAEAIDRHILQREMEELAFDPHALRRPSAPDPAPPYIPRPPSYSEPLSESLPPDGGVPITNHQLSNSP